MTNKILCLGFCGLLVSCATSEKKANIASEQASLSLQMASDSIREGDHVSALAHLDEAEKLKPEWAEIDLSRSLVFYGKKDLERALSYASSAIQKDSTYSAAYNARGRIYLELSKWKEAEADLKIASSDLRYREAFQAFTNLGIVYYKTG